MGEREQRSGRVSRIFIAAALLAISGASFSGNADARSRGHHRRYHSTHVQRALAQVFDGSVFGGEYYTSRNGDEVHRPIFEDRRPRGATAHCRDGSWSFSENHRGTCSHHGGVGRWL